MRPDFSPVPLSCVSGGQMREHLTDRSGFG